ncbi:MAG: hypothetical protein ACRED3_15120 [Bradyrhizobium sp.]
MPLEAAHVSGRRFDEPSICGVCDGRCRRRNGEVCGSCRGTGQTKTLYVKPVRIIPLCGPVSDPTSCHAKDHTGDIDVLPLLNIDEQLQAVTDFEGIENARVRLAPSAYREGPIGTTHRLVAAVDAFTKEAASLGGLPIELFGLHSQMLGAMLNCAEAIGAPRGDA